MFLALRLRSGEVAYQVTNDYSPAKISLPQKEISLPQKEILLPHLDILLPQ